MTPRLRSTPFDAERHLPNVQDFDCGAEDYQVEIAEWIKNSGAGCIIDTMRDHLELKVWVYTLGDDTIVGYGSLGVTRWRLRGKVPGKKKVPVLLIANMGMRKEFQGEPKTATDKSDRYSSQILGDLIAKA